MNDTPTLKQIKQRQKPPVKVNRQKKLSQALRENLAKRKAQLRQKTVEQDEITPSLRGGEADVAIQPSLENDQH